MRHCSYVVSSCSYDPGNLDFEYTTVPALNGAASAISFQSMNFPTKYLTTSTDQTPSGRLGIVGPPDPLDQDTASWTVTAGPQSNTVILGTMSKDPTFFGQVITLLSSNSPPCDWPLPDGDLVLAPLLSPSSPTQLMHFEFKPPPPGPTPPPPPPPPPSRPQFDQKMKEVGMEFAKVIQPGRSQQSFDDLADALNGGQAGPTVSDGNVNVSGLVRTNNTSRFHYPQLESSSSSFFVCAIHGNDEQVGSLDAPFRTLSRAIFEARKAKTFNKNTPVTIILRQGTYYQGDSKLSEGGTIYLTEDDSDLTIAAAVGEEAWISGGVQLNLTWTPFRVNATTGENIWVAQTPTTLTNISGLRLNNSRQTRARYPNCDVERVGWVACGLISDQDLVWFDPLWCKGGVCKNPPTRFEPAYPSLANESRSGTLYTLGIGGDGCSQYSPPAGFNCVDNQRWGGMVPRWPAGFSVPKASTTLPNSPYNQTRILFPRNRPLINMWSGWFSRHWEIGDYDASTNNFTFGRGGFQGGEGFDNGFPISVENIFEELDSPSEWWWDAEQSLLYMWHNASVGTPPPSDGTLIATQVQVLFNSTGTQENPVSNVKFLGLGFRDTALTLLEPHGLPSSGDWALQRTAAIFLEGTVNATIDGCVFERLDGLGIFLSGYARGAIIQNSEFSWMGETAIALWGYTRGSPVEGFGPDTTGGDQPRGTYIGYNIFRQMGIWQKQSSAVFQAESGLSLIEHNWMYNGPRAAICFNDGSLGGSVIQYNVMANLCTESGDHGPFNSWSRTAYFNDLRGFNSVTKLDDVLAYNFIIANYGSMAGIDNDDTSSHYEAHHNVISYSMMALKADFAGYANSHHDSVYPYVQMCAYLSEYHPHAFDGEEARFFNNICSQFEESYYVLGQTCNYTQPNNTWTYVPGIIVSDSNTDLDTHTMTIEEAKASCGGGTSWCVGFTYENSSPNPNGTLNIRFSKVAGVVPAEGWSSWVFPEKAGLTVVANNTLFTGYGLLKECGLNLTDWQAQDPSHDPGTTVAPFPDDDYFVAKMRITLGLPTSLIKENED